MSKEDNSKPPTHIIWQVIGDNENARWYRIGAAWPHKDGKGFGTAIRAWPTTGRIVIREATEKRQSADEAVEQGGQQ